MNKMCYQNALVTGATSGIGRAITEQLAAMGLHVYALGRKQSMLESLSKNSTITPIAVDVTDREAVHAMLDDLAIDVFVNNAGVMPPPVPFYEIEQDDIDNTLEVNLSAAFALTRQLLPGMVERRCGHVFFIGSTAGHAAFPNMSVYGASKAAIASLAASLRCDLAGSGVRVTEVVPGRVKTALYDSALGKLGAHDLYDGFATVAPEDVALMVKAVLEMPAQVNVSRFDILPTAQYVGGGAIIEEKK
jgi:3-hydroxy acid dehydrogenase/malonic semialdehyde reductase